jgi:hypothetical protein
MTSAVIVGVNFGAVIGVGVGVQFFVEFFHSIQKRTPQSIPQLRSVCFSKGVVT